MPWTRDEERKACLDPDLGPAGVKQTAPHPTPRCLRPQLGSAVPCVAKDSLQTDECWDRDPGGMG